MPSYRARTIHFLQKAGIKTTNNVKNSKRPNNIAKLQTHVCKSVNDAYVDAGPTPPNPGPRLFRQATAAEKAVIFV